MSILSPSSQIHSPFLGDKVDYDIGFSSARQAKTNLCHSRLYPTSQGLWIGPQIPSGPKNKTVLFTVIRFFCK